MYWGVEPFMSWTRLSMAPIGHLQHAWHSADVPKSTTTPGTPGKPRQHANIVGRDHHHHLDCYRLHWPWSVDDIHLDLLRVCRQIYQEAVLVPFASNRFVLGITEPPESKRLEPFLARLVPAQVRAITHLIVDKGDTIRTWQPTTSAASRLTGLRHLQLAVLVTTDSDLISDLPKQVDSCCSGALPFGVLPLISVGISVSVLALPPASEAMPDNVPEVVWEWRDAMKRKLSLSPGQ